MKNLYFSFFAIIVLFNFSCDDKSSEFDNLIDEEEVKNSIDLDTDLDFLETLSLNEFERENSRDPQSLPDCVTITVIIQQGFKEITLDFGDGCQVGNKNIYTASDVIRQINKNGINKQINILLKRRDKLISLKVRPTDITNLQNK